MNKIAERFSDTTQNSEAHTAAGLIHSRDEAAALIAGAGLQFSLFQQDCGDFPSYGGGDIFDWIIEQQANKKAPD